MAPELLKNMFITRWFSLTKKQHCFSQDVITDIDWNFTQARTLGACVTLVSNIVEKLSPHEKLLHLWMMPGSLLLLPVTSPMARGLQGCLWFNLCFHGLWPADAP